jgi:hypothetical protein
MAKNRIVDFQLVEAATGRHIKSSGGKVFVAANGTFHKATIYDVDQAALANPMTPNQGRIYFQVAKSVAMVDLYIQAPKGQFIVIKNVVPGDRQEVPVDVSALQQTYVIPWAAVDSAAATEQDTGFDLPTDSLVSPHVAINVGSIDATETLDFGILSSESGGDADGFGVGVSVATLGTVALKSASTATRGALIGAGTLDRGYRCDGTAKSISYTTSSGSDTGEGTILLPVLLAGIGNL